MARAGAPVCLGDRYGATPGAIERAFAAARQSELVEPQAGPHDDCFDGYPELSIEDWHRKHGLWIE